MLFVARRRHQFWTADVRYLKGHKLGYRAYVISVLDKPLQGRALERLNPNAGPRLLPQRAGMPAVGV